jgi:hypothetical protein
LHFRSKQSTLHLLQRDVIFYLKRGLLVMKNNSESNLVASIFVVFAMLILTVGTVSSATQTERQEIDDRAIISGGFSLISAKQIVIPAEILEMNVANGEFVSQIPSDSAGCKITMRNAAPSKRAIPEGQLIKVEGADFTDGVHQAVIGCPDKEDWQCMIENGTKIFLVLSFALNNPISKIVCTPLPAAINETGIMTQKGMAPHTFGDLKKVFKNMFDVDGEEIQVLDFNQSNSNSAF